MLTSLPLTTHKGREDLVLTLSLGRPPRSTKTKTLRMEGSKRIFSPPGKWKVRVVLEVDKRERRESRERRERQERQERREGGPVWNFLTPFVDCRCSTSTKKGKIEGENISSTLPGTKKKVAHEAEVESRGGRSRRTPGGPTEEGLSRRREGPRLEGHQLEGAQQG
jgi:hypothetical protein